MTKDQLPRSLLRCALLQVPKVVSPREAALMLGGAWGETSQLNPKFPSQEYSAIVTQNPWLGLSVGEWSPKDPSQPKGP